MKKKSFDWQLMMRVIGLAKAYQLLFIASAILAIVLAPLGIARPYLINVMVDDYIFNNDLKGLARLAILFMLILAVSVIMRYLFIYVTNLLGQNVIRDLRIRVFNHITSLRLRYFDITPIGTSTTRTINDIETINTVFSQGLITIIADILGLLAVLIIMFLTSWQLTLICLLTFPLLLIGSYIFKEKVKTAYQKVRTQISNMNAFLQERITGMRIIQIFNAEEQERNKFRQINRDYTQANLDSILYYAVFFPFVDLVSAASLALMIWWGARGVLADDVTIGAIVAFPIYLSMLFRPMRMLADRFNTLQMGLVAAERVFSILDKKEKIDNSGQIIPEKFSAQVAFQNVSFSYDEENFVLNDISFDIEAGESLAIVGATGSGKSTIINILSRFYDIQKGSILIDEVNIKEYELKSLRDRIAVVLQDVFLFGGSVFENITLRNAAITREEVEEASKKIGAHEFIEKLPGSYNFVVTERGSNLSMGQRQLISFVRALVFDPDILVLDEATSSVDSETEAVIQFAIETLITKRTSIIIAHRLSTIRNADKIMVMEDGSIAEIGSHEQLMAIEGGHYKKMFEIQFQATELSR